MAIDGYTKVLLHMNGADGSVVFTDVTGKVWTPAGNAQIDTAQSRFGGASALFDGAGDWIDTPDHDDFTMGSGDFTVDFWMRYVSGTYTFGQMNAAADATSTSFYGSASASQITMNIVTGSTYKSPTKAATMNDSWHHCALIRSGNNLYAAVDGVLGAAVDVTGVTANNSPNKMAIGRAGEFATNPLNGHIDEFRISKGIARWTANFTPPGGPYGGSGQIIMVMAERWKGFLWDLKAGLVPPDVLRRRYRDLVTI